MTVYDPWKGKTYEADIKAPGGKGKGLLGVPPFIDMHTHVRGPHFETYTTLARACTAGGFGICTIQPNTKPHLDRPSTIHIHMKRAEREKDLVSFLFTASLFGEQTDMGVAYSTDGIPYTHEDMLYHLKVKKPRLLMDHSQLHSLGGMFYEGAPPHLPRRGLTWEAAAVFRTTTLAYEEGWRDIHIQHVSSPYTVETVLHLRNMLKDMNITMEITPHHLLLSAEDIRNTNMKINPPLAPHRERQKIIEMVKKGLIDALATDHAPHPDKGEDYEKAPYGSSHIEVAFSAFYTALGDIYKVVDMLTVAPSRILGVQGGTMPDNMVVIDPEGTTYVDGKRFLSMGKNTAFDGMTLRGRIVGVKRNGRWIYWEGEFMEGESL